LFNSEPVGETCLLMGETLDSWGETECARGKTGGSPGETTIVWGERVRNKRTRTVKLAKSK
jgi:hypothetical protein